MAISQVQNLAQRKYDAAHTKQFQMKLHLKNNRVKIAAIQ